MFDDLKMTKITRENNKRQAYRKAVGDILLSKVGQKGPGEYSLETANDYSQHFRNVYFEADLIPISWEKILKKFNKSKLAEYWHELKPDNTSKFALCFKSKLFGNTVIHNLTDISDIYSKVLVYDDLNNKQLVIQRLQDFLITIVE